MILVKNKLKKVKNKYDDDEMLNYLKYSHLERGRDNIRTTEVADKATQLPDIMNNFIQTDSKETVDKETDTYDELNKIIGEYVLNMSSNKYKSREPSRGELMAQAWTQMIERKEGYKSSSSSSSDSEGALSRNIRRGFRIAEMAGNAVITTFNVASDVADFLAEATSRPHQTSEEEEEQQEEEQPSGSNDEPTFMRDASDTRSSRANRDRSRSHDDEEDVGHRLLRRGASRSRSSTPKGYPPKKKNNF